MITKRPLKRLAIVGLVLMTGLAGALGYVWLRAQDYRSEIQAWAASVHDQPLSIGALETDWRGWTVQLRNVRLLGGAEAPHVEQVRLRINPLASLWKRSPRLSQVQLSGLTLTLMRELNGSLRVSGIASGRGGFLDWVLKQPELVIKDSHLTWDDRKTARSPLDLRQVGLRIHNNGTHHRISVSTRLPHKLGGRVRIAWQAVGDLREDWSGEVSLAVKNVRFAGLGAYLGIGELKQGRFNLRCRSEWRDGRPMHLNGAFDVLGFSSHEKDDRTKISAYGGFTGSYRRDGWVATVDPIQVHSPRGAWPKTKLTVMLGDAKTGDKRSALLRAEYLLLQDIYPVLSVVAPGLRDQLRPVRSGELRDFEIVYLPKHRQQLLYRSEYSALALAPSVGPVIEQSAGTVVGSQSLAKICLSVGFVRPAPLESAIALTDGEVLWRRNVGVDIAKLHLVSGHPNLNAKLSGRLVWDQNARPSVQASATFSMDGGAYWLAYSPPKLIPRGAHDWLSAALPSGRVTRGRLEFNQPAEKKSSLNVHLTLEDATLTYARGWPQIEGLDAELDLDNDRLEVALKDGTISGARIQAATLRLPDLASPRKELIIEGQASGPYAAGRQFVMASPLRETVGKQINDLAISGPIVVDLALKLPLPRGTRKLEVRGSVRFAGVKLQAQKLGVELENLSGLLRFDRRRRWGRGFEARYLSRPAKMDIDIAQDQKEPSRISLRGEADRSLITALSTKLNGNRKNTELLRRIHGHAPWQAILAFPKNWYEAGARSELRIRSDLQGLALLFPEPLGKRADEERLLEIRSELGKPDRREIAISYAGAFAAELAFLKGKTGSSLSQATIRLGDSHPRSPPASAPIHVMGKLRRFNLGEWLDLVRTSKIDASTLFTQQITLEIRLHQLELFGHTVSDLSVRAQREQGNWQVHFDGPSIRGRTKLADSATSARMHLQHLKLVSKAEQRQGRDIDPRRLPALWVQCEQFQYNGIDLGKMALYSEPQASGMRVKALSFTASDLRIDAKGSWELVRGRHATTLEANVKGQDLSAMMKRLTYDMRTMEAGETEAAMRLRWPGTPAEFGIDKLSGRISLGIAQGRLLDVEPRIGRIFGLLSFQSLQRRLSLDFDDLFKKGFAFDRITGSFQLNGGNAYTNDLTLVGPSARVEISGRIGLARRDYEQVATVTPELASSLPVASALFGPVGVGVGAALLLAEQVFDSLPERIDGMVRRHYTITGPWERPIVKALKNAKGPAG
ncbi:MAG: YhdP family protein [Gammaproteobacteria bacterium]